MDKQPPPLHERHPASIYPDDMELGGRWHPIKQYFEAVADKSALQRIFQKKDDLDKAVAAWALKD